MSQTQLTGQPLAERGKRIYEEQLRSRLEIDENIGKILAIDVESGDYEIGKDLLQTTQRLRERRPDGTLWGMRIGYDAVYAIGGGSITRITR